MFSPAVVGAILLVSLGAVLGDSLTREQREDPNIRVTDDAIIIEVTGSVRHRREIVDAQAKEDVDKKSDRSSRQFFIGQGFVIPNAFLGSYPSLRASPTLGANSIRAGGYPFQDGGNPFENSDIPFQNSAVSPNAASAGRPPLSHAPCITSSGQRGKCASFRQCYPYFKVPDLTSWGPWVFGGYDTCNYYSDQIKQPDVFQTIGVCCVSPVTLEGDGSFNPAVPPVVAGVDPEYTPVVAAVDPAYEAPAPLDAPEVVETLAFGPPSRFTPFAGWPPAQPPLPTHPPDHAAPTHPPSFGQFTTKAPTVPSTTTKKPLFTTWGTKQTTKATQKPIWPPPVPTHGPPSQTTISPGSSESHSYSCGGKNGHQDQERIVGGHNADPNEWPWVVALFSLTRQFCGGSLIDDSHILTAAHCVAHMTSHDVAGVTVRLGDHNIHVNHEVRHIEKRLKRVVRHKGFDMRTLYNDISVLTMDSPVTYSKTVRPICLPRGGETFAGSTGTVVGWGSLREGGAQPSVLQEVSIPIWSNMECRNKYGPAAPGGIVEHMLCAGRATKDSCSGDSGGPLTVVKDGTWYQVGVVSWGIGCGKGQYPGVYSRVSSFLPWITKNTS